MGAIDVWVPDRVPGQKGRPVEYSELAIECCLMIRQVFHLPLRQTEGLVSSLVRLMDVDIAVPDYSCLSKRSIDLRVRIKRTIAEVYTYRTAVAGSLPHQFQPISPPTHPRRTSFQPLEAQFSVASQ
jgi:hypothetical protein